MDRKLCFLLLSLFAFTAQQGQAAAATQDQALAQVREEARRGNYQIISPGLIRDRFLGNPDSLLLIDTRQEWEYQREHIKQAMNLPVQPNWWTQYSPWVRANMKKLLGPDLKRRLVFY